VFFKQPTPTPTSKAGDASKRQLRSKGLKPWQVEWNSYSDKGKGGAETSRVKLHHCWLQTSMHHCC
jgi:hypothetical protein